MACQMKMPSSLCLLATNSTAGTFWTANSGGCSSFICCFVYVDVEGDSGQQPDTAAIQGQAHGWVEGC